MSITAAMERGTGSQGLWLARLVTAVLFLLVCLSWGTTWLGIRIAVESVPPLTSAGLRFLIAFPLFLLLAVARNDPILFPRDCSGFFVFVTLAYFGVPYYLLNYGEQHVSSGLSSLLFSSMPIFILIFSAVLLRERIYLSQVLGITIGFASLYRIVCTHGTGSLEAHALGVAAILAAAVMHGFCYVMTKKHGAAISVITFNTLPIGIAGMMLFAAGLWLESPDMRAITVRSWTALAYLGIVASAGGFLVYFMLLKRLSPVILSFVFIVFPVIAVVAGSWYEGVPVSHDLALYTVTLLAGFTLTRLPLERLLLERRARHR